MTSDVSRQSWPRVVASLALLNVALTFENVWPTPAVWWTGGVSVELALGLLLLVAVATWREGVVRRLVVPLAWLGVVLVLGRYAVVTSPALFGRDVNLYWDLQFVPDVIGMLARPASWLLSVGVVLAVVAVPYGVFRLLRWALGVVVDSLQAALARRVVATLGVLILGCFLLERRIEAGDEWQGWTDHRLFGTVAFPPPVSATYAAQLRLLAKHAFVDADRLVGPSPDLTADLGAVRGADVVVFFVESYGASAYDRPEFRAVLSADRQHLSENIRASGRDVVSAFVESPTFGGGSWLAHISLLTGIDVRDEDTNQVLLTQARETLVSTFDRQGYRTVAVMPGLQREWPEGGFYRFDDIYGELRLNYEGPQFGWWVVPDQYSLARLDALELNTGERPPVFAFMAGVSTHTPFSPTAPYQPDWDRLMTRTPFSDDEVAEAFDRQPDWLDLGPSYVRALQYVYASLGGYLRHRADRDLVMVVIGDHQPPAMVAGMDASWDVPVHVVARRAAVLDRLEASGFVRGLEPPRQAISGMHALAPTLLSALSSAPRADRAE